VPIVVRELVVKATIDPAPPGARPVELKVDQQRLIERCVMEVLRALDAREER
jgi:hypothetical protein